MQRVSEQEMSTAAKSNIQNFPGFAALADDLSHKRRHWGWLEQRLYELGIFTMPDKPNTPGFLVNWTSITCLLIVVMTIAGLWFYTWSVAHESGFKEGIEATEKRQLLERLEKAEKTAQQAKDLNLAGRNQAGPGHEQEKQH